MAHTSKFNIGQFIGLIRLIKPKYRNLWFGLLFGAVAVGLQLWVPLLAKSFLNRIARGVNLQLLSFVGVLFVFSILLGALSGSFLGIFGEDVVYRLRIRLWQKALALSVPALDAHHSAQIPSRITNDAMQVKNLLADSLPRTATSLLQLIGALGLMIMMDLQMTLIMFVAVPLIVIILLPIFRLSSNIAHRRQDALASLNASISEVLGKIRLVKSSTATDREQESGANQMQKLYRLGVKEAIYDSVVGPTTSVIMLALVISVLAYGIYRISLGTMDTGTLMAFLMYMIQLIVPFTNLGQFMTDVAKASGSTDQIQALMAVAEEDTTSGMPIDVAGQDLVASHLSFTYPDGQEVLHDLSFTAKPNETIAFVGPSGSGKTTIFNLLERFYAPDQGKITIGNTDIADINLINWRQQLGLVGQGNAIISGSIRYNLTYGLKTTVTDDQIWQALAQASAKDFVQAMPHQLETIVGDSGMAVSGGQQQRLTIARAFLRNPKILMLDEATASLDPQSEQTVQATLRDLMANRTTLVIAHRINTIMDANQIYFIENGRISGAGTHAKLLQTHPLYRQYFESQIQKSEPLIQVSE
ncbi:ABC transporter ATP-binding protein [Lacticaseibacillus brantae]|uniref:Multidrug resistance ABC transporter ATP-binding and permease protein n=1 Tax=Lacticaseibacillus brantae DSM 23927 TaxID=1423727 RepID=A0A0R2B961_9LACO|nr:ABC transporter ATP-binding protein [Lacticaseibacillus brantae]KRM72115.1 multidrug transporter hora like protein [Lacticaseibacillus brantae DSM 23927]